MCKHPDGFYHLSPHSDEKKPSKDINIQNIFSIQMSDIRGNENCFLGLLPRAFVLRKECGLGRWSGMEACLQRRSNELKHSSPKGTNDKVFYRFMFVNIINLDP